MNVLYCRHGLLHRAVKRAFEGDSAEMILVASAQMNIVIDGIAAVGDRLHVHNWAQRLRGIVARVIRAQAVAPALLGGNDPFDNDLGIRGHQELFSPSLRRREPERLSQSTADDRVLVDVDGHAGQGPHTSGGMMTDPSDGRQSLAGARDPLAVTLPIVRALAQTDGNFP